MADEEWRFPEPLRTTMIEFELSFRMDYYIFDEHRRLQRATMVEQFENDLRWPFNRKVALTQVGPFEVSTILMLGPAMPTWRGKPVMFETKVFLGAKDIDEVRYSSLADALRGHCAIVAQLSRKLNPMTRKLWRGVRQQRHWSKEEREWIQRRQRSSKTQ